MLEDPTATDRRTALKARHRQAIVTAAAALMERTGGTDFTVDELAREADVSRRTVFNHFDTVDDILVAACGQVLGAIIDTLDVDPTDGGRTGDSMFDEIADALRNADLVPVMARIAVMLGGAEAEPSPRQAMLFLRATSDLGARLSAVLSRRHPGADELTVELLVTAFMSGTITVHRHWVAATAWRDDGESRRIWDELLERLIDTTRSGHAAARETRG